MIAVVTSPLELEAAAAASEMELVTGVDTVVLKA